MTYSEKEIAIFEGVRKLALQGADLRALKADDIARAAGLGKGTLYNYFSSKEEIISHPVLYDLFRQMDEVLAAVEGAEGFLNKCRAALTRLGEGARQSMGPFQLLLLYGGIPDWKGMAQAFSSEMQARRAQVEELAWQLACLGAEEGLFPQPTDRTYVWRVFTSATMGFQQLDCAPCMQGCQPLDEAVEEVCRLLVKALS